jgi:REP element-mobilizing transposase RayT
MCRGNRQSTVFRDERDNEQFLKALGEVALRCGWRIHAYVLMGNHYHLLLETPEPNLVAGMQWLQGTYTKRFNVRHKEWGHLFQGRYKALLVETGAGNYFSTIGNYVHLNPARVRGYDFEASKLEDYAWSSYPAFIGRAERPEWLYVDRLLEGMGLADSSEGREVYRGYVESRMLEMELSSAPWKIDKQWDYIRRGWCFGGQVFRLEMLDRMDGALEAKRRDSFSGDDVRRHDEIEAERLVGLGMNSLALKESDLEQLKKSAPEKYAIAWLIRKHTSVRTGWIKERLKMGTATNFAQYLKRLEVAADSDWGAESYARIKNIKL